MSELGYAERGASQDTREFTPAEMQNVFVDPGASTEQDPYLVKYFRLFAGVCTEEGDTDLAVIEERQKLFLHSFILYDLDHGGRFAAFADSSERPEALRVDVSKLVDISKPIDNRKDSQSNAMLAAAEFSRQELNFMAYQNDSRFKAYCAERNIPTSRDAAVPNKSHLRAMELAYDSFVNDPEVRQIELLTQDNEALQIIYLLSRSKRDLEDYVSNELCAMPISKQLEALQRGHAAVIFTRAKEARLNDQREIEASTAPFGKQRWSVRQRQMDSILEKAKKLSEHFGFEAWLETHEGKSVGSNMVRLVAGFEKSDADDYSALETCRVVRMIYDGLYPEESKETAQSISFEAVEEDGQPAEAEPAIVDSEPTDAEQPVQPKPEPIPQSSMTHEAILTRVMHEEGETEMTPQEKERDVRNIARIWALMCAVNLALTLRGRSIDAALNNEDLVNIENALKGEVYRGLMREPDEDLGPYEIPMNELLKQVYESRSLQCIWDYRDGIAAKYDSPIKSDATMYKLLGEPAATDYLKKYCPKLEKHLAMSRREA